MNNYLFPFLFDLLFSLHQHYSLNVNTLDINKKHLQELFQLVLHILKSKLSKKILPQNGILHIFGIATPRRPQQLAILRTAMYLGKVGASIGKVSLKAQGLCWRRSLLEKHDLVTTKSKSLQIAINIRCQQGEIYHQGDHIYVVTFLHLSNTQP